MKKIILVLAMATLTSVSLAQPGVYKKEDYKDYKACPECLDNWKGKTPSVPSNPALNNYGIPSMASKATNPAKQTSKRILAGVVAIFVTAVTISLYSKANNVANNAIK